MALVNELIQASKAAGKNKVLVEGSNITREVSLVQILKTVEEVRNVGGAGFHIAIIAPQLKDNDISRFADTVSYNRSIRICYFSNEQDAIDWLKKP